MRIAITGGAGFLGLACGLRLSADGHRIMALDRGEHVLPAGIDFRSCDIADDNDVDSAFAEFEPDVVIHFAALLTLDSKADIVAATRVNALGTAVVFSAAQTCGARRVVYASSVAALGDADTRAGDATTPRPASVYGATKAFCEHLARACVADTPEMTLIGLRYGSVYGPGRARGWRAIQTLVEQAVSGVPRLFYPDFPQPIDWTWIGDAAEVAARAVTAPLSGHHVFNVVGDKRFMREAADHLKQRYPSLTTIPQSAQTPPSAWDFANDGLEAALGYTPHTKMEGGIDQMIDGLV
ncbi:NAD-dependent epimerase/dehydratase family protein [Bosea sp. RAC05]|jgi:UDP-glucose 4-epimerase|uniref:NAD-dependent epimerase/dehydratase family protein n=1 Tax=Bosea sp. RAC05 TaxID=1842539 RepID=UPI00123765B3|nr:NAD(P)-dependent oxidoreductase [Bosea sp. RAC05]